MQPSTIPKAGLRVAFSEKTGAPAQLSLPGGESVLGFGVDRLAVDACLKPEGWLSLCSKPGVPIVAATEKGWDIEIRLGPIQFRDQFHVEGATLSRRLQVLNMSDHEVQLTAVRLWVPGALIGDTGRCRFAAPATSVRPGLSLEAAHRQILGDPPTRDFAPGAGLRWGRAMEDAPDASPGLLALHHPGRNLSLLVWYYSEIEAGTPIVFGDGDGVTLGHEIGLAGWLQPSASLSAGIQYIRLESGSWQEALSGFQDFYLTAGVLPPLYGNVHEWVRTAAVYETHPGLFGGFLDLTRELSRIRSMGFTVLYLMPVMQFDNRSGVAWDENWIGSGSPYAMKDFEAFEPTLGTAEEFRALVAEAHRLGMRVLMDFVPQGCALDSRYVREHPEWFCRDEEGHFVSSHGWIDTYSLDWANPGYHDYMVEWALRFMREYGIDGYRIDAPHAKEPNWDRAIPYHASYTGLGVLRLLERLRTAIREAKSDAAMLSELFGPVFVKSHDFQYDYLPSTQLFALLGGQLSPVELGEWLRDYWAVMPRDAARLTFTETHDTRVGHPAYAWRGSMAERAMFALLVLAGFVPMVWSGQEAGLEDFYHSVLTARAQSPALLHGTRVFNQIACDHDDVMSILCRGPEEIVWGVVSLHGERTPLTFRFPALSYLAQDKRIRLHDLLSGRDWDEYGKDEWRLGHEHAVCLSLVPYVPYFFRIENSAGETQAEAAL